MRPFNIDVDYEGKAFGLDYCVQIVLAAAGNDWASTVFVRFPPGHTLYRREITEIESQDIPSDLFVSFCDFGTAGLYEDHTSWWVGLTFSASKFGNIVEEAENLIRQLSVEDAVVFKRVGGATVGTPAWEVI